MQVNTEIKSLSVGKHSSAEEGACVMEFVSLLANEPFSDRPRCASSSITSFCIWINDNGDQEHRDRLLVLAPRIVGTTDYKKEPARAKLYSEFAFWNMEKAKGFAKAAKAASHAHASAEYAKNAAEYAKDAAKNAKNAAEYAKDAAEYAKDAAFKKELYDKAIETLEKVLAV